MTSPIILSHNENPYGISPKVKAELVRETTYNRYPAFRAAPLIEALSKHYNLNEDQLLCSAGSEEILYKAVTCLTTPGDDVLIHQHSFHVYTHAAKLAHANPVIIAQPNLTFEVDAILEAVTEKTTMIILDNPCNPLGCYLNKSKILQLLTKIPSTITVLLDAAYAEFVTAGDYCDGRELIDHFDNLIVTRTFSKLYGLAGLRLGWAYSSATLAKRLTPHLSPYSVNTMALMAGLAALSDQDWVQHCRALMIKNRDSLESFFKQHNVPYLSSQGNFVLCNPTTPTLKEHLALNGIQVRDAKIWKLPDHIRISLGTEEEMDTLYQCWPGIGKHLPSIGEQQF